MPFQPGARIGAYEITVAIGAGGMGEVYRARDTSLNRDVAIKVLPEAVADDADRLARFQREAEFLATLNHTNIAQVYGLEKSGATPAIVMELVEGPTLADRIRNGPIPAEEALPIAHQIAEALEAAHERGVIHRDLKPANIKVRDDGTVKVLDFGLAKALDAGARDGQTAGPSDPGPTMTSPAPTEVGVVLGTAAYMAPEQARGKPVDRRVDIWAFGCVLYEMLAGARAFDGGTLTDVLAAVVTKEPDWQKLPVDTPDSVRRLLRWCLEKNARKRLRDAGDASLLLDESSEDLRQAPAADVRPARRRLLAPVVAAALLAGTVLGWGIGSRESGLPTASDVDFRRLTFARGMMRSARFAPDGQTIVYGAAWDGPPIKLYLVRVDAPESTPIALPPAELLAVSATGEMAVSIGHAYDGWVGDGTLARTSLLGGSPREILEHVRIADWSPDGTELAIVRRVEGVDQLEFPVGTVLRKTAGYFGDVRFSPDGRLIAFTEHPVYLDDRGDLATVDLSGRMTTLQSGFASIRGLAWAPGGTEIWFTAFDGRNTALFASDLDGRRRVVHPTISDIELFDIAPDGRILLGGQNPQKQAQALLAGFTEPRNLVIPGESSMARALAPDGRSVLVSNQLTRGYETYLVRSDRPGATRLSSGDAMGISPDGNWGLSMAADARSLFLSPLGAGQTRTISAPDGISFEGQPAWLPDSRRLVVLGRRETEESRAFVYDLADGTIRAFGAPGVMWQFRIAPPVSPDGKFVVLRDAQGTPMRWPIDGGDPLPIPGLTAEDIPMAWYEDGRALFVGTRTVPMPISRLDLSTGRRTAWMTITPADPAGLRLVAATITPDGKYWALSTGKLLTTLFVVSGLR